MEETIGYEALLSADEWDSLDIGEWTDGDGSNPDGSPSGVTRIGEGCAAPSQEVASEGTHSHSLGPSLGTRAASSCDENLEDESTDVYQGPEHKVSCTHRVWGDEPSTYLLECEVCEIVGSADTLEEAQAIARLHESFVAELVGRWEVE